MDVLAVRHYMLVFLFLVTDIWGQGDISIKVKYHNSADSYFVSIGFSPTLFKEFYACLCGGQAMSCAANYTVEGPGNYPVHVVYKEGSVNQNFSSPISYTSCFNSASSLRLICSRLMASLDEVTERMQYFRLISSQGCKSNCVGFIWFFEGEEIHSNILNSDFQTCDINCNCPASAVATSTPAIPAPGTSHHDLTGVTMTQVTSPLTAATSDKQTGDDEAPLDLIIGVVVAGIIIALVIVVGVVFWRRRRETMNKAGKGRRSKNSSIPFEANNNRKSESLYTETNFTHDSGSTGHHQTSILLYSSLDAENAELPKCYRKNGSEVPKLKSTSGQGNRVKAEGSHGVSHVDSRDRSRDCVDEEYGYSRAQHCEDDRDKKDICRKTAVSDTDHNREGSRHTPNDYTDIEDKDTQGSHNGDSHIVSGVNDTSECKLDIEETGCEYSTIGHSQGAGLQSVRRETPDTTVEQRRDMQKDIADEDNGYSHIDHGYTGSKECSGMLQDRPLRSDDGISSTKDMSTAGTGYEEYDVPVTVHEPCNQNITGQEDQLSNIGDIEAKVRHFEYSTAGELYHSDTGNVVTKSPNVYARLHEDIRKMKNPYNALPQSTENLHSQYHLLDAPKPNHSTSQSSQYSLAQPNTD